MGARRRCPGFRGSAPGRRRLPDCGARPTRCHARRRSRAATSRPARLRPRPPPTGGGDAAHSRAVAAVPQPCCQLLVRVRAREKRDVTAPDRLFELDRTLVPRLGYGTMRLTGPGALGPPPDMDEARRVLRRALELGVRV